MHVRQKIAVGAVGVLGLGGIGAGTALAQSKPSTKPTAPAVKTPAHEPADTPEATDTDTVQAGDQTTPDTPGTAATATPAAQKSAAAETPGVEEPGDALLPGGGHADPPGATVDTQFEGVQ